jgi:NAD(P)-dependent dehydrogenase (short-subunit alcohol dehydrogenase family)
LNAAADAIRRRANVSIEVIAADLATKAGVEAVTNAVPALDILVNNAGAIPSGRLTDVAEADWRDAWDLKVFGFINLCRSLYPVLAARQGVIVNIIGSAGEKLDPQYIAGSTGNAALMAFTRALAKSAIKDGIRVVGINPGMTATDRMETLLRRRAEINLGDASRWLELTSDLPLGRPAQPEEIASAATFLASPRSGYTSGTILTIDGARS